MLQMPAGTFHPVFYFVCLGIHAWRQRASDRHACLACGHCLAAAVPVCKVLPKVHHVTHAVVETLTPWDQILLLLQLESVATVGVVVILAVLGIIVHTSIQAGLPAIKSGELPLWTFQVRACTMS